MATKNFLTLEGLTEYDAKIKEWSNSEKQKGFKSVLISADKTKIYFYKKPNAVLNEDTPDAIINLPEAISSADKKVWFTDNTTTEGTNYAKIYKIYQGENAPDAAENPATLIGTINIPKDMVVQSGSVVKIVYKESDNTLHEGSETGTDVTVDIKGTDVPGTAEDAGSYVKLVVANSENTKIYIKATDLVANYIGGTNAEMTIAIDPTTHAITGTIKEIDGHKVLYKAASPAVYKLLNESDEFDGKTVYYTKSGTGTTEDPYVYNADDTVTAENFSSKVAGGLYIKTAEATEKESIADAIARLDAMEPITGTEIGDLFKD